MANSKPKARAISPERRKQLAVLAAARAKAAENRARAAKGLPPLPRAKAVHREAAKARKLQRQEAKLERENQRLKERAARRADPDAGGKHERGPRPMLAPVPGAPATTLGELAPGDWWVSTTCQLSGRVRHQSPGGTSTTVLGDSDMVLSARSTVYPANPPACRKEE